MGTRCYRSHNGLALTIWWCDFNQVFHAGEHDLGSELARADVRFDD